MNKRFTRILATSITAAALIGSLGACGKGSASATSEGSNEITMWTHNAGNKEELAAIQAIVDGYNKSSEAKTKVKVQAFPQDSYNDSVVAAAAAGKLPCILDIDGPNVPNWAWAKYLTPLEPRPWTWPSTCPAPWASGTARPTRSATTTSRWPCSPASPSSSSTASASPPSTSPGPRTSSTPR